MNSGEILYIEHLEQRVSELEFELNKYKMKEITETVLTEREFIG